MTWRMIRSLDFPTTSRNDENIQNVNELVHRDCRMTVRMLAEELGYSVPAGVCGAEGVANWLGSGHARENVDVPEAQVIR